MGSVLDHARHTSYSTPGRYRDLVAELPTDPDALSAIARIGEPVSDDDASWLDGVAELLLAADEGDLEAERSLLERYRHDDGPHPGPTITQASPFGDPLVEVELARGGSR